jgi:hypothetical protein
MKRGYLGVVALCAAAIAPAGAHAAVIPGPFLNDFDGGWTTAGVSFTANQNSDLTSFVFQSEGQSDTIVLADSSGTVLHSVGSSGGTVNVNWALSAGNTYWLLQTTGSNARFTFWNGSTPSDVDISLVSTGIFSLSVIEAVNGTDISGSQYWAAFNDITTSGSAAPEPASWAMMLGGFGLVGGAMRSRRKAAVTFA